MAESSAPSVVPLSRDRILLTLALTAALRTLSGSRDVPGAGMWICLLLSTFVFIECFARLDGRANADTDDAFALISRRRRDVLLTLCMMVAAAFACFGDVLVFDRTAVSHPYYNVANDPAEPTAGHDYLVDAWAGYLIEGPGILQTQSAIRAGEWPHWNHREGCGSPFLANGELAVTSLVQAPLHLLGSLEWWSHWSIGRFVIAAWLAALFILGIGRSPRAAALGGCVFGFSGNFVMQANLVHLNSEMLTPLILLCAHAFTQRRTALRWCACVGAIGLSFNGGNPQPTVVALLTMGIATVVGFVTRQTTKGSALAILGGLGAATVCGAALAAVSLLPLADLLAKSVSRALLQADRQTNLSAIIGLLAPAEASRAAEFALTTSVSWYCGVVATVGAVLGLAACRRSDLRREWPWIIALAAVASPVFTAAGSRFFGSILPISSSVNWGKYVGSLHLMIGLTLAGALDRLAILDRRRLVITCLVGSASLAAVWAGAWLTDGASPRQSAAGGVAAAAALAVMLLPARARRATCGLAALLVLELAVWRPVYPTRPATDLPEMPPVLARLEARRSAEEERTGQLGRTLVFGDLVPPMTSGLLGLTDLRSVSPTPLENYHDWLAPYVNCGDWPPYLMLGASRVLLLSPCVDLAAVRWVVIRDALTLTHHLDSVLEPYPSIRFGELHRAIDFDKASLKGLIDRHPQSASFTIDSGARLRFPVRFNARSTSITLGAHAVGDFRVDIAFGGAKKSVSDGSAAVWVLDDDGGAGLDVDIEAVQGGPITITILELRVERYTPKNQFDYALVPAGVDADRGIIVLENKNALPMARLCRRVRRLASSAELAAVWRRLVSHGEGWDWRRELLVVAPPDDKGEASEPSAAELATEWTKLEFPGRNTMRIDTQIAAPAWLHLAVVDDGWWRATVDGTPVEIHAANGPFMAVPLERPGRHTVEFSYDPVPFKAGAGVSGMMLAVLGMTVVVSLIRRSRLQRASGPA